MNMNKKLEGHPISKVDPGSIGEGPYHQRKSR